MNTGTITWTAERIDEHRLEIENRIRNLFWTVSGDYSMSIHPDVETFVKSQDLALYDAVKQGAFASRFNRDTLALYLLKKKHLGADEHLLTELLQLCTDAASYPLASRERPGIEQLRRRAFEDFLRLELLPAGAGVSQTRLHELRRLLMLRFLNPAECPETDLTPLALEVEALGSARTTDEIVETVDRLYHALSETGKAYGRESLERVKRVTIEELLADHKHIAISDEQMQLVLEEFMEALKQDMLRLKKKPAKVSFRHQTPDGAEAEAEDGEPDPEQAEKVYAYIERNFGKSYLTRQEQEKERLRLCRGMHHNCTLYFTEGILSNPAMKNTEFLRTRMLQKKNELYVTKKKLSMRRNIEVLAAMLRRVQIMRQDEESSRAEYGQLNAARLWKVGRTHDPKLFDATHKRDNTTFVVDILLDGSSSQNIRQPQVAAQGYIISQALSKVGIPHRVSSFCSYWDYTLLHRYRDFDDPAECNKNILQFRAFGDNRDGLAILASCDSLLQRPEDKKLLIILSDGRPNNLCYPRAGSRKPRLYVGEDAVKDTAFEVRRARNAGISVLGIYVGAEEDVYTEKRIYGKEFAYTRNISSFSHIVGSYLCRMLEQE